MAEPIQAKETQRYPFDQGPYLLAAFLCEKVLVEQDGVKSAIRIIDRLTRTVVGPAPPDEMEPFEYDITLFLRFKSGRARGRLPLEIQPAKPSGEALPPVKVSVIFEGEDDRGIDSVGQIRIKVDQTGVYWFNVLLDNVRVTRIPFRVVYLPQVRQIGPRSDSPPPK